MKKARRSDEDLLQEASAKYLDLTGLLWFHPPNGGFRRQSEAVKFKRMGVKAGVPDILVVCPFELDERWHPGLAIELKSQSGRLTNTQKSWKLKLESEGWRHEVCRSLKEIVLSVEECYGNRVRIRSKS